MKYCSIIIFFYGVRFYVCLVMVMVGREIILEELICCVFGVFIYEGIVFKIVNDFYCCINFLEGLILIGNKYFRFYLIVILKFLFLKIVINFIFIIGVCKV